MGAPFFIYRPRGGQQDRRAVSEPAHFGLGYGEIVCHIEQVAKTGLELRAGER